MSSNMKNSKYYVYSFYRFIKIRNKRLIKLKIDNFLSCKSIRGTILIADEGINGSLSADYHTLDAVIIFIKKLLNIRKLEIKVNETKNLPFNRIKVRLKKEIVSLGMGEINVNKYRGKLICPTKWDELINKEGTIVIDVRNTFEISIGTFKNAINPNTISFREFPKKIKNLNLEKHDNIAMFCTGGIRCEKASAFLKMKGYKNISQLDGGIIKYLETQNNKKTNSLWNGECFVFDNRVTINNKLKKGKYLQCYGCRRPIKLEDTFSDKYKKGICCPYCIDERSEDQKSNSEMRQLQIEKLKKNK